MSLPDDLIGYLRASNSVLFSSYPSCLPHVHTSKTCHCQDSLKVEYDINISDVHGVNVAQPVKASEHGGELAIPSLPLYVAGRGIVTEITVLGVLNSTVLGLRNPDHGVRYAKYAVIR
jgi:hypothetical protein